jgi:hypothetical protein
MQEEPRCRSGSSRKLTLGATLGNDEAVRRYGQVDLFPPWAGVI